MMMMLIIMMMTVFLFVFFLFIFFLGLLLISWLPCLYSYCLFYKHYDEKSRGGGGMWFHRSSTRYEEYCRLYSSGGLSSCAAIVVLWKLDMMADR